MSRLPFLTPLALLALAAPAIAKNDYAYGPKPDWTRYKALGEAAVRARLTDPKVRNRVPATDWVIEWPNGFTQGGWRHKGLFNGYVSCGRLRSVAPIGEPSPVVNFVVVIDHDVVSIADISTRESNSLVNVMCEALVQKGILPPAKLMDAPQDSPIPEMGVTVRSMAEGAYVVAAARDGIGQRAGLAPGMVITRVNGVALAGMGPAMSRVLGSDAPRFDLDTATGEHFTIERAR